NHRPNTTLHLTRARENLGQKIGRPGKTQGNMEEADRNIDNQCVEKREFFEEGSRYAVIMRVY
ncbi:MAG: hypothetical protein AAFO01_17060, partial [Pseudomonadota bacterium]